MTAFKYALGIDIGGTNVKMGIVRNDGTVLKFNRTPSLTRDVSIDVFASNFIDVIGEIMVNTGVPLTGIGVSTPGFLNPSMTAPVVCASTPVLNGFNFPRLLESRFDLPVTLQNDLVSHALAEYYFGTGVGVKRFMCVAIGTGIGAGMVVDGQPLTFSGGTTGDTGRIVLIPGGEECVYGVKGSAEALCGSSAVTRLALERYGRAVTAQQVIENARQGDDQVAIGIVREVGEKIGWLISSLSAIFQPQKVALTGGIAEAGEILLQAVADSYEERMATYNRILYDESAGEYGDIQIVLGKEREQSGLIGAVALFFQQGSHP